MSNLSLWARVRQAFAATPRGVRERIITQPSLAEQIWRIGGGLTPIDVSHIMRQADTGDVRRLIDLGNDSRQKDTHLQSVLYTREIALQSLPIQVIEPEDATSAEKAAADLCRKVRDNTIGGNDDSVGLLPLIEHMQAAIYFSFSVAEIDWRIADRFLIPQGFWLSKHRQFCYDPDDGRLKWAEANSFRLTDFRRKYPGRFIHHAPSVNRDAAVREGLIRVLTWAALFRNWTQRDWLTLAEIAWKPWRIGTYKEGAGEEDKQNLWDIINSLTTTGGAVMSDRQKLDIHYPANGTSGNSRSAHNELYTVLGEGMSKAVVGQTLTTEASARGTQALGTVQNEVREDYRSADAHADSATLMRDLWVPLVRLNFGDKVRVPAVFIDTTKGVDRLSFAQAMKALREGGLQNMSAKWVRKQIGAPEPEPDEELLIPIDFVDDADAEDDNEDDAKKPPRKNR